MINLTSNPHDSKRALVALENTEDHTNLYGNAPFLLGELAFVRRLSDLVRIKPVTFPEVVDVPLKDLGRVASNAIRLSQRHEDATRLAVAAQIADFLSEVTSGPGY